MQLENYFLRLLGFFSWITIGQDKCQPTLYFKLSSVCVDPERNYLNNFLRLDGRSIHAPKTFLNFFNRYVCMFLGCSKKLKRRGNWSSSKEIKILIVAKRSRYWLQLSWSAVCIQAGHFTFLFLISVSACDVHLNNDVEDELMAICLYGP